MSDDTSPPDAPGWSAIDRTVGSLYPGQVPHQFASERPYELDGQAPLPAVSVWSSKAPTSWHYVSYGLSELFEKTSPEPSVSGFGVELTLRVPRGDADPHPPVWGVSLIQTLAHYVLSRRKGFDSGHTIDLGAPIDGSSAPASALTGIVCLPDPLLRQISTPHGSVLFLQLVGVEDRELRVLDALELERQVALLADLDPTYMTDPARSSWIDHEEYSKIVRRYKLGIGLE